MFYISIKGLRPKSINPLTAPATMVLVADSCRGERTWHPTMAEFRAAMAARGWTGEGAEIYEAEFIQPLEIGFLYKAGDRRFILYDDGGVWPAGIQE